MKDGETILYYAYEITKVEEGEFIVAIAHDSLEDAKNFIRRLINTGELEGKINEPKGHQKKKRA